MTETFQGHELNRLYHELLDLAMRWRGANVQNNIEERERLMKTYHAVIHELFALDWDGNLDVDGELPDKFLPVEYFRFWDERNSTDR